MDREKEIAEAHAMLDQLSAPGRRGTGSIRERLGYLLLEIIGRLPGRNDIISAMHASPPDEQLKCR